MMTGVTSHAEFRDATVAFLTFAALSAIRRCAGLGSAAHYSPFSYA